jgi:hypothetical protein
MMLDHFLDVETPPNHRSISKYLREGLRERDKYIQVITSKVLQQQEIQETQRFIPRFGNPTKELLRPRC